jgi:hypothetical protein
MATAIDVTLEGLHQLRERIERQQLEGEDWVVVGALVSRFIARTEARQARLKARADQQADPDKTRETDAGSANDAGRSPGAEDTGESGEPAPKQHDLGPGEPAAADSTDPGPPKKGHGRNGADAFRHAATHLYTLTAGILGALCAVCRVGRVFRYRAKVIIRVVGQPIFAAQRHQFEQGRCRICGAIVTAEGSQWLLREGVGTGYILYDWSACAMLSVMHYFAGGPFKRLEALQQGWGTPMPDANQWRIADACDDLLAPLYKALEKHAIQNAVTLRYDDTGSMIIQTRRQIQNELQALALLGQSTLRVRTGINATCVYIETREARVVLFFTGPHHAGEIVDGILSHRTIGSRKLVSLTDAAAKNFSHDHTAELEEAVCHAHCYLQFRAVKDSHPSEYAVAGEVYEKVFDNEDKARTLGLDPEQRMRYHREHSKPQMLRLWEMCKQKIDGACVEPPLASVEARLVRHQPVASAHQVLRNPRYPSGLQPCRAGPDHPGSLSGRLLRLQDPERRRCRRSPHVLDRHRQRQWGRARRLPDRVPAKPRRPRQQARALPALGLSRPTPPRRHAPPGPAAPAVAPSPPSPTARYSLSAPVPTVTVEPERRGVVS